MSLTADGAFCAYGGKNGKVYIISMAEKELVNELKIDSAVYSLAFGLSDVTIAVGTEGKVLVFDVTTGEFLAMADLNEYGSNLICKSLVWSANNNLIIGLSNGTVAVLDFVR